MKIRARMGMFSARRMAPALFRQLWDLFPEFRPGPYGESSSLDVDLPADDPRVERARSLLEGSGMKLANPFRMREDDEYSLQYERTYEPADLEVVELLEPGVHVDFDADYKDATGRVLLRPSGTEALVRVMVEAPTDEQARAVAERLAGVVRERLAI